MMTLGKQDGFDLKLRVIVALFLLLLCMRLVVDSEGSTSGLPVIRILSDGSISPPTDSIQRNGYVYTFSADLYARIVVERDNIVIEGSGYTLHGNYNGTRTDSWVVGEGPYQDFNNGAIPWSIGIDLANENVHNLTVKDLNIKDFYIGIYVWTPNNTVIGCSVSGNIVGVLLSGDSNILTKNYISGNEEGVFFGVNQPGNEPLNIVLVHNSFVDNIVHFSGCFCEVYNASEPVHTWDDGKEGNYWDTYNGTDADGDGIGDIPYVIDVQNQDRFPLMQTLASPLAETPKILVSSETLIAILVASLITMIAIVAYKRRKAFDR
jgi:parallel beta-helix repeat protein